MNDQTSFGARQMGKTARLAELARPGAGAFERGILAHQAIDRFHRFEQTPAKPEVTFIGHDEAGDSAIDAWLYGASMIKQRLLTGMPKPRTRLDEFTDAELVMHMLGRGYACMKVPASGEPPETLR
jgi:hypothetical protein